MDIKERYAMLSQKMDERGIRLFLGAEAKALGWGGITQVHRETGVSRKSIALGVSEIEAEEPWEGSRIRRKGGGRKRTVDVDTTLKSDLEKIINSSTRGDPEKALLWTSKSVRKLTDELKDMNHKTSHRMVNELLWEMGYSLQANRKVDEGGNNPDRNEQFEYINRIACEHLEVGEPVISVDTKKKELVGNFKNSGQEWHKKKNAPKVNVYDFKGELGKVSPYGVYDIHHNKGWVNVGISSDTAEFAVESIRKWWNLMGKAMYSSAGKLLITADGGGSNGSRVRLWKFELQKLANETGLEISVSHYPPGTSKWNKIEHRLFSSISQNWRGKPLLTYEVVINLIAATTTQTGLTVRCELDSNIYERGKKVSDTDMRSLAISNADFHGDWNYTISPQ